MEASKFKRNQFLTAEEGKSAEEALATWTKETSLWINESATCIVQDSGLGGYGYPLTECYSTASWLSS